MRSLRLVAVLLVALPTTLGFACSSSDSGKPAATAAGGSGAGDAGAGGAAGTATAAGGSGAGPQGGVDSSGGNGAGPGPGPMGAGAGPSLCKTSGDGAIFGLPHPDCQPCAVASCDAQYTEAYGAMWSTGDLTSGGKCQAYESCAIGKCKCAPACVMKTCMSALSGQCQLARDGDGANPFSGVKGCMQNNCALPCGLANTPDAGPLPRHDTRAASVTDATRFFLHASDLAT